MNTRKTKRHNFFDPATKRIEVEFETFAGPKIIKGYVTEVDDKRFYVRQDNGREATISIDYLTYLLRRNNNDK